MSYRVISFDGLATPVLRQSGDEDNMGTGSAQVDFRQVPGGGFYRLRRGKRSPQGIRPVTKSGVLRASSAADLRAQLEAWRAKVGVYGKLVIRHLDGSTRWQWAELQDFDAPVANARSGCVLPVSFTWQTAAQHWNGTAHGTGWMVGDDSFYLGDGFAELGQGAYRITLAYNAELGTAAETLVFGNNWDGNIDMPATLTVDAANAVTAVSYQNLETGQEGSWTGTLAAGESLRFRGPDLSVARLGVVKTVVSAGNFPSLDCVLVETGAAHGLSTGDNVEIAGLPALAGVWYNITVQDSVRIKLPTPVYVEIDGSELSGAATLREYTDAYAGATINDLARFLTIKPGGSNHITVNTTTAGPGDSALVEYTDAYA